MPRKFLRLLNAAPIEHHVSRWERDIGPAACAALRAAKILYDAPRADWYPCGGSCGERRRVVRVDGREKPYLAVCVGGGECGDRALDESDLRQYGFSFDAMADELRRLFDLDARGTPPAQTVPGVHRLGSAETRTGARRDVYLATTPHGAAFDLFLANRGIAARDTLVLVSNARWLSDDTRAAHGPGQRVELLLLEDDLVLRDGRLARVLETSTTSPRRLRAVEASEPPFCVLITKEREQTITRAEYDALLENIPKRFDVVFDAVTRVRESTKKFGFHAHHPNAEGKVTTRLVSDKAAAALVEFIGRARGTYLAPADLDALETHDDPLQAFTRAWRQLDPERHLLDLHGRDGNPSYRFRAEATEVRWAVLRALPP